MEETNEQVVQTVTPDKEKAADILMEDACLMEHPVYFPYQPNPKKGITSYGIVIAIPGTKSQVQQFIELMKKIRDHRQEELNLIKS